MRKNKDGLIRAINSGAEGVDLRCCVIFSEMNNWKMLMNAEGGNADNTGIDCQSVR